MQVWRSNENWRRYHFHNIFYVAQGQVTLKSMEDSMAIPVTCKFDDDTIKNEVLLCPEHVSL